MLSPVVGATGHTGRWFMIVCCMWMSWLIFLVIHGSVEK